MSKRLLATILALVMIIGLLPIIPASTTAYAADNKCGDNITWQLDSAGTLTITGYGKMYDYYTDEHSERPWEEQFESIKKVVFKNTGSGITSIGNFAFDWFINMTDIVLPPTLTTVGDGAFRHCHSLKDFSLPESVTSIGDHTFWDCPGLTKVPSDSRLKNVTFIDVGAFMGCTGIIEAIIPPLVSELPASLYASCTELTQVVIPETVNVIGAGAFSDCTKLEYVALHPQLDEVEAYAFNGCSSLNKVYIGNALTMGEKAFDDCAEDLEFFIGTFESFFTNNSDIDQDNDGFYNAKLNYSSNSPLVLHPNGGKFAQQGNSELPLTGYKQPGEIYTVSTNSLYTPVREGYYFSGWNTKPDGSGKVYLPGDTYSGYEAFYLYAQWSKVPSGYNIMRLSGNSRNGTSVAISEEVEMAMGRCEAVVLANGWNFADALAGGPLAYALKAPILLITGDDNDEETFDRISRMKVTNIYILGGTVAVSEEVETRFRNNGCYVERIAGDNRFETAVLIAEKLNSTHPTYVHHGNVFFAYSHNYPDALAVSGIAAMQCAPILYIDSDGVLDPATEAFVGKYEFENAYILGGTGAIKAAAEGNIKQAGAKDVTRISGSTRYETCIEINKQFPRDLHGNMVCVSTGTNFPDALAGSVLAAAYHSPLLLVEPDEALSASQKNYIGEFLNGRYGRATILGGKVAVPDAIENELKALIP